jgi:DNA-binding MarR family transcriptional regulator
VLLQLGRKSSLRDPVHVALEKLHFTPPQVHSLLWLGVEGSLTMGEIAGRLGVTEKTVTGLIDRLRHRRFVVRTRDTGDRRVIRVHLTKKGKEVYQQFEGLLRQRISRLMSALDSSERRTLIRIFQKIANFLTTKEP